MAESVSEQFETRDECPEAIGCRGSEFFTEDSKAFLGCVVRNDFYKNKKPRPICAWDLKLRSRELKIPISSPRIHENHFHWNYWRVDFDNHCADR